MKLAVYLALIGAASSQAIAPDFEEELEDFDNDLQDMLDITVDRAVFNSRGFENKMRALDRAWRDLGDEMEQKWRDGGAGLGGAWGPKLERAKTLWRSKYQKEIEAWVRSPEVRAAQKFGTETLPNSPDGKKLISDAKQVWADVFGLRTFDPYTGPTGACQRFCGWYPSDTWACGDWQRKNGGADGPKPTLL